MEVVLSGATVLVPPAVPEEVAPPATDADGIAVFGPPIPITAPPASPEEVAAVLQALVPPDQWDLLPPDVRVLLALLPQADVYLQDELEVRLHPTLTRCWAKRGAAGQRRVQAPGQNQRLVCFGVVDWRDGWHGIVCGRKRSADLFVEQLDCLVARSQARGRIAIVILDNARTHTARGSKLVREAIARHGEALHLVYTPAYHPDSNRIECLWHPFRRAVTHNHQRTSLYDLYEDLLRFFESLDADPGQLLRYIHSPFADGQPTKEAIAA